MSSGRSKAASRPTLKLSEDEFLRQVIEWARINRWRIHHQRPGRVRMHGRDVYRSNIVGHKGVPDLVLARDGQVLLVELKTDRGEPSPEQVEWLKALGTFGRLWRPRDWKEIECTLR